MSSDFPPIVRGASLLLAWQLKGKKVLLVGGGEVAASRLGFLLEAGAYVTIVSPGPLHASIAYRVKTEKEHVTWHDRTYGRPNGDATEEKDLAADAELPVGDFDMVFTAIDDNPLSRAVCLASRQARRPVNVADVPPECDFYFGAQVRRGPLQAMVSTSGAGPKIAVMVRDIIAEEIPEDVEDAIEGVGALRRELRERAPGVGGALSKRRMRWMIDTCDAWKLSEMGLLKDPQVRLRLLDDGWEQHRALGPSEVGATGAAFISRIAAALHNESVLSGVAGFISGAALASAATLYILRRP